MDKKKVAKKAVEVDRKVAHKAAEHSDTPLVRIAGAASEIADQPPLIALSMVTIAAGAVFRRPVVFRVGVRMLAAHAIATGIKTVIKKSVDRTRPAKAIATGAHRFEHGHSDDHDLNSFPSGHTAGAVAIAQAVAHDLPAAAVPIRLAAAGIGAIQLPREKHYLIDVIAGAAIGWASEQVASAALAVVETAAREMLDRRKDETISQTASGGPIDPPDAVTQRPTAAFSRSTRSVFSQVKNAPSASRPKWP